MRKLDNLAAPSTELPVSAEGDLVVGAGSHIVGTISAPGRVRLAGELTGDLTAAEVIVESGGRVGGSVTAQRLEISGHVSHAIVGSESVLVRNGALVEGDLDYKSLVIEAGAQVLGNLRCLRRDTDDRERLVFAPT